MFAPFPRTKRARSPSPPYPEEYADLASPLDILIKRRRRDAAFTTDGYPLPHDSYSDYAGQPESSTAWLSRAGVNGRRSRQWQQINAPSSSNSGNASQASTQPIIAHSQPIPPTNFGLAHNSSPDSVEHGRALSQPVLPYGRQYMSSSPIRHEPPGSSPFRASQPGMEGITGMVTPDQERVAMREDAGWGEDELGREWGEYARENSVLYSIHKSRNSNTSFVTPPNPHHHPTVTPHRHTYHSHTPAQPTPYRNHPPSSGSTRCSPFVNRNNGGYVEDEDDGDETDIGEDRGMEMLEDDDLTPHEAETRRRYEDANRLLAELAVARQERWGET